MEGGGDVYRATQNGDVTPCDWGVVERPRRRRKDECGEGSELVVEIAIKDWFGSKYCKGFRLRLSVHHRPLSSDVLFRSPRTSMLRV